MTDTAIRTVTTTGNSCCHDFFDYRLATLRQGKWTPKIFFYSITSLEIQAIFVEVQPPLHPAFLKSEVMCLTSHKETHSWYLMLQLAHIDDVIKANAAAAIIKMIILTSIVFPR